MKLTVLGSGSMSSKNACSSYLLEYNNEFLLIDAGFGSITNLKKIVSPLKIHNVLISHYIHADHVIDLIELIWAKKLLKEKNQLNLFGPKGFKEFIQKMLALFPALKELSFNLKVKELSYSNTKILSFEVSSKIVKHEGLPALGFRIKAGDKTIAYSGDSEYCSELIDLSKEADLLIIDTNNKEKKSNHMTPIEAALIAEKANAKTLLLTHLSKETEDLDVISIAAKEFKGKIIKAKDLLYLEV